MEQYMLKQLNNYFTRKYTSQVATFNTFASKKSAYRLLTPPRTQGNKNIQLNIMIETNSLQKGNYPDWLVASHIKGLCIMK